LYLKRMESIDPSLMLYTPSDDWIPGTVRWRKGHLGWLLDGSAKSLAESIAVAQEGIVYLQDVLRTNSNSAGISSGSLNVGWLYFLQGNPICLDYFDQAMSQAQTYSPRTEGEAALAKAFASAKFRLEDRQQSIDRAFTALNWMAKGSYGMRNYAFLRRDEEWDFIRRCLISWHRINSAGHR